MKLDQSMAMALLIAWSAVLGATAGIMLGVLTGLLFFPALRSGENGDLFRVIGCAAVLGAVLGGLRGWHESAQDPDDPDPR